jgi:hypothetical protein
MRSFALLVLLGAAACSEPDPCEPAYAGKATDEAWRSMVDGEPRAQAGVPDSPVITEPSEGQVFSPTDAPPRVAWSSTLSLAPASRAAPRSRWARVAERLMNLVERRAEAHGTPVTGAIYFLHFDIAGRMCPYSAITTDKSWQIDDAGWTAIKAVTSQPISIRMTSAYLTENRIMEGPFSLGAPRTFSVK